MNGTFEKLFMSAITLIPVIIAGAAYFDAVRESWKRVRSISGTIMCIFVLVWITCLAKIWR